MSAFRGESGPPNIFHEQERGVEGLKDVLQHTEREQTERVKAKLAGVRGNISRNLMRAVMTVFLFSTETACASKLTQIIPASEKAKEPNKNNDQEVVEKIFARGKTTGEIVTKQDGKLVRRAITAEELQSGIDESDPIVSVDFTWKDVGIKTVDELQKAGWSGISKEGDHIIAIMDRHYFMDAYGGTLVATYELRGSTGQIDAAYFPDALIPLPMQDADKRPVTISFKDLGFGELSATFVQPERSPIDQIGETNIYSLTNESAEEEESIKKFVDKHKQTIATAIKKAEQLFGQYPEVNIAFTSGESIAATTDANEHVITIHKGLRDIVESLPHSDKALEEVLLHEYMHYFDFLNKISANYAVYAAWARLTPDDCNAMDEKNFRRDKQGKNQKGTGIGGHSIANPQEMLATLLFAISEEDFQENFMRLSSSQQEHYFDTCKTISKVIFDKQFTDSTNKRKNYLSNLSKTINKQLAWMKQQLKEGK